MKEGANLLKEWQTQYLSGPTWLSKEDSKKLEFLVSLKDEYLRNLDLGEVEEEIMSPVSVQNSIEEEDSEKSEGQEEEKSSFEAEECPIRCSICSQ